MSKVSYDPETGIFTWVETKRRGFIGKKAGCFVRGRGTFVSD